MKRYKYLISYSYVFNNIVYPGRIITGLNKIIKDEETILEVEKHIREIIDKEFKEQQKDAFNPKKAQWLGVLSFQLLNTVEVLDTDEEPINIVAL
jgi:hypothetical protein